MLDLLIRGGRVIDPINRLDVIRDVAIKDGRVVDVAETIELAARKGFQTLSFAFCFSGSTFFVSE